MKRFFVRSRSLLLVVALAVIAAMCTVSTARAASPGTGGVAVIHAAAASPGAAASSAPCNFQAAQTCQSTDPAVTVSAYYYGDTSACTFVWNIDWGDSHSTRNLVVTDPANGWRVLSQHTYAAPGTYTILITGQVTAGSCVESDFSRTFTLTSTPVPTVTYYAALGDSYSAGKGTGPAYPNGIPNCGQSVKAYPALLDAKAPSLGRLGFIACSGDVTDDFYANRTNLSQLDALGVLPNVRTVTLTIGGNDIGFVPVIKSCLDQSKDCYKSQEGKVSARLAALAGKGSARIDGRPIHAIATLLTDIHAEAPNAQIFLVGYPRPFGTDAKHYTLLKGHGKPGALVCYIPSVVKFSGYVRYDDAQWFDQTADTLNGVLANAVAKAKSKSVPATFVSVRAAFTTHGDCDSGSSWLTPYNPRAGLEATLHPTEIGQQAYERDLLAAGI